MTEEATLLHSARRSGLIGQVIEQLREQITSGGWPLGSRIPTETELAKSTGTSRNTVREAVGSLVHAGLLERRQGSGTYVRASSELAGAVSRQVAAARWRDVIEVRRTLEVGAAHLAALHRTPADLARMRELLDIRAQAVAGGDLDGVVLADVALHRAVGDATHNTMLIELYGNVLGALYENVRRNVEAQAPADGDDHAQLVAAIEAADPELAAREAAAILDSLLCRPGPPPDEGREGPAAPSKIE